MSELDELADVLNALGHPQVEDSGPDGERGAWCVFKRDRPQIKDQQIFGQVSLKEAGSGRPGQERAELPK
jgi:hypothetical protein